MKLLRFDVVEQMNKKVDLTRLKKTTHCNSRAHFLLKTATGKIFGAEWSFSQVFQNIFPHKRVFRIVSQVSNKICKSSAKFLG